MTNDKSHSGMPMLAVTTQVLIRISRQCKMADVVDHASYSLVMDFASEEDWLGYIAGAPHMTFHEFSYPFAKHIVVTQYDLPDA